MPTTTTIVIEKNVEFRGLVSLTSVLLQQHRIKLQRLALARATAASTSEALETATFPTTAPSSGEVTSMYSPVCGRVRAGVRAKAAGGYM